MEESGELGEIDWFTTFKAKISYGSTQSLVITTAYRECIQIVELFSDFYKQVMYHLMNA